MLPKSGLLGTLSTIALGAGPTVAGAGAVQAQVNELCTWIQTLPGRTSAEAKSSIASLTDIVAQLQKTGGECVFGPTGEQFCKPCIEIAAAKIVDLTATAAGPPPRGVTGGGAGGGGL